MRPLSLPRLDGGATAEQTFGGLAQFAPAQASPLRRTPRTRPSLGRTEEPRNFKGFATSLRAELSSYRPGSSSGGAASSPAARSPHKRRARRSPAPAPRSHSVPAEPALTSAEADAAHRVSPERSPRDGRGAAAGSHASIGQLRTAWDAIEYLTRVNPDAQTGSRALEADTEARFVHLNLADNKDFRPYDLVVTDELHRHPEHFTMSSAGMFHTVPGEESEFFSLEEWSQNAVAFSQCCRIPFFKSYAVTKGFHFWRKCVNRQRFGRKRDTVGRQLFGHRKSFRSTHRVVMSACAEVRRVKLCDIEHRRTYTLDEFREEQLAVCRRGQQHLTVAIDKMERELVWLCDQLKQRKRESEMKDEMDDRELARAIETHMSMSEVRAEQQKRARLLRESITEAKEVGVFVRLADIVAVESEVLLATESVVGLQSHLQRHLAEVSHGMFAVQVDMDSEKVVYSPTMPEFLDVLQQLTDGCVRVVAKAPRLAYVRQLAAHVKTDSAQFSSVEDILAENIMFSEAVEHLMKTVTENYSQVMEAGADLEQFRELHNFASSWGNEKAAYMYAARSAQDLQKDLQQALGWKELLAKQMKVSKEIGIFHMDTRALRDRLRPLVDTVVQDMKDNMAEVAADFTSSALEEARRTIKLLSLTPKTVTEFAELLTVVNQDQTELLMKVQSSDQLYSMLQETGVKLNHEDSSRHEQLHEHIDVMQKDAGTARRQVDSLQEQMCSTLDEAIAALNEELVSILAKLNSPAFADTSLPPTETLDRLKDISLRLRAAERSFEQSMEYESQFRDNVYSDREPLDEALQVFAYREELWTRVADWQEAEESWLSAEFVSLDVQSIQETVVDYLKAAHGLYKRYNEPLVLDVLKKSAERYQQWMPTLFDMGNPAMLPSHWAIVFEHLGVPVPSQFSLRDLIEWRIFDNRTVISETSAIASGEWSLAQSLRKVEKSMDEATFVLNEHHGVHILSSVDDLYGVLEENKMTLQIMRSSRFIEGVKQDVESWERKLGTVDQVLDEWLFCQRNWLYLQNIFTVPDIQKQLPTEAADFRNVDLKWRDIMAKTSNNPNVMECTTQPGVLEMFLANKEMLQRVQRSLDDYLETKRMAFARFYFLSDAELLQILSQTKDPTAVQSHMNKLFNGIKRLDFDTTGKSLLAEIKVMHSGEGESVEFDHPVTVSKTTNVEDWLNNVERMMTRTLLHQTRDAYSARMMINAYSAEDNDGAWHADKKAWLFKWPAMSVLAVEQIAWRDDMERALQGVNPLQGLKSVCEQEAKKLAELTALVRTDLKPLELSTIEALLVISIHEREMTVQLSNRRITSTSDFNWLRQLKYCYDHESQKLTISQLRAEYLYRNEYLGNSSRLVITPLTDRCYLTMTNALMMKLGGCPYGKAGTGKTETVKDLAKALARQCIVFNCSDGLDHKIMGKFFSGLAQSGAWACFDEFNRIDVDVLSVISTQCLTIQQALMGDLEKFSFEGRMITLDRNYGCFVTMNPSAGGSYGGRAELPDNLKSLFRPVAMMVPDTALIAKSMLSAQGFDTYSRLAHKITHLYRLASEQLSHQKHYDWELRAMKPVLSMAGALKRADREADENILLIRALRQSSLPKLVGKDIVLFEALVSDLFPNVVAPTTDYGSLQDAIETQLELLSYTVVPSFVSKTIQLLETLKVRHGVGLVGSPGTGKSVAQEVLATALTSLSEREGQYSSVIRTVLNPKAVSIGELYGEFNEASAEWTDGLVPALVRRFIDDSRLGATKWICFDGPVDPHWIENMNTVLDDNKLLCLLNSERIKLPNNINMLFEVQDLQHASPATVSRCGMVYFEEQALGWRPVVSQWLEAHKKQRALFPSDINEMFDSTIERTLVFLHDMPGDLETGDSSYVQMFLGLLGAILSDAFVDDLIPPAPVGEGSREKELEAERAIVGHPNFFGMSMAFAYVWSFGARKVSAPDFTEDFNRFAQDIIPTFCRGFPNSGASSVYDFHIDYKQMKWARWAEAVPAFAFVPGALEQMVPTVETTRASYIVRVLLTSGSGQVLLTGKSGSAKTSVMREFQCRDDVDSLSFANVAFTAKSAAADFQPFVEMKLDQRSKDLLGPPSGTKMVVLVDDLSLVQPDKFGDQQCSECVRQLIDSKGFFDRKGLYWKNVVDTQVVASRTPHGGGHVQISQRLLRHFHTVNLSEPDGADLKLIFGSLMSGWIDQGADEVAPAVADWISAVSSTSASATVSLFGAIRAKLLPSLAKSHYIFNVRDVLRVFEGFKCYSLRHLRTKDEFIRLWAHESCRVFVDRLNDEDEVAWVHKLMAATIEESFGEKWEPHNFVPSCFGAFNVAGTDKDYRERVIPSGDPAQAATAVMDLAKKQMIADLKDGLELYQLTNEPMELVLFEDVLRHLSATCRAFRQGRGNMLLLGLSGCGRRSVVKLAAHVVGAELAEVKVSRGYGMNEFHEDLKPILQSAGVAQKPVVFFLSESQITDENFLRDLSNILDRGRVPGLFSDEEMMMFGEELAGPRAKGPTPQKDTAQMFAENVMKNLHVVVSMTPVGNRYLHWIRIFPALTSWCTADWYHPWPKSALLAVARSHLAPDDKLEEAAGETQDNLITDVETVCRVCVAVTQGVDTQIENVGDTSLVITPKFFVELLKLFKSMLVEQESRLKTNLSRLSGGLDKLAACNQMVDEMQASLRDLQPQLAQMAEDTIVLMGRLAEDKEEADKVRAMVRRDQHKVEDMTRKCEAIAKEAAKDLEEAMPAYHAAVKALNTLQRDHIIELKSFKDPPNLVKKTMEAVCILKNVEPSWKAAQQLLQNFKFLDELVKYPKDDVTDQTRKALGKFTNDPEFTPEKVGVQSTACKSLCMWALAIDQYAEVNSHVRPKKARLHEAEQKAMDMQQQLEAKQQELAEVNARVEGLQQNYEDSLRRRDNLDNQMHDAKIRIARAEKLTTQLGDEQQRWSKMAAKLESDRGQLVGDTLLAAAFIGYAGTFDVSDRAQLVKRWIHMATDHDLPVNIGFSLEYTLGDPVELREWKLQGLPPDQFSVENSLVVKHTRRWPLLTDPQGQASAWIKKMEAANGVQSVKANDPNMLRTIENAIRMGMPVLLENVGETVDPSLRPIFQKQTYVVGGRMVIRLGDVDVDYHPGFKLYMTCNLPNPKFTTDVLTTLTVINFAVTRLDLEDQLLTMVVAHEKPDLEEQKDSLVLDINKNQKLQREVEEKILDMLKSTSGNILDDETLIEQLDRAKSTSESVAAQLEEAELTAAKIEKARSAYRSVATRGSVLYFAMSKMSGLNPMYHNSLGFFRDLFGFVMKGTVAQKALDDRLRQLIDALTGTLFDKVCRGLFEKDKLLFGFMITAQILIERGEVSTAEWEFLVRGPSLANEDQASTPNPCSSWLPETTWANVLRLSSLRPFASLPASIGGAQQEAWRRYRSYPDMHTAALPARELNSSLSLFQKLLLVNTLREDMLELSVIQFVENALGRRYIEPTNVTLEGCFEDTSPTVPTIFILSPAADPTQLQLTFARSKDMEARLDFVSLGRGQGPAAEKLIRKGCASGRWVCLQNCHLYLSWMPHLEALVEEIPSMVEPQSTFRLWLTSYPTDQFPVPLIQCSVKMSNEMPRGLRANLLRTYRQLPPSKFETVLPAKRKLLFSLAFLHAALLDRCTFGSIGFNIPYEWTAADLDISVEVLNQDLNEGSMEQTLTYMIGNVNYGGRVTDSWDQRCVQSLLAKFLRVGRSKLDISFDDDGAYFVPETCDSQSACIEYIQSLPIATDPSVFGLHGSADITFRANASEDLLQKIVTASHTHAAAKAETRSADNAMVLDLAERISAELGKPLVIAFSSPAGDALRIALEQEVARYNQLHTAMRTSLADLEMAMDGHGVMTESLDAVFTALLLQRVPQAWKDMIDDVSHKSLASWTTELSVRLEFMRQWCANGPPCSFYLPGLVCPQVLLASITQQYGRANGIAIDTLRLHTQVTRLADPDPLSFIPDLASYGGVFIHGLWLEGGRWDLEDGMLKDPVSDADGVALSRFTRMPVLWCRPVILRDTDSPSDATPRSSTPGPQDDALSSSSKQWDAGSESSSKAAAATTSAALSAADSEVASLTGAANLGSGDDRSGSPYTARTPTPLPPDSVIYPPSVKSFTCPVYKTAHRGLDPGAWVMNCELTTALKPDHWVLRGAALMCEGGW